MLNHVSYFLSIVNTALLFLYIVNQKEWYSLPMSTSRLCFAASYQVNKPYTLSAPQLLTGLWYVHIRRTICKLSMFKNEDNASWYIAFFSPQLETKDQEWRSTHVYAVTHCGSKFSQYLLTAHWLLLFTVLALAFVTSCEDLRIPMFLRWECSLLCSPPLLFSLNTHYFSNVTAAVFTNSLEPCLDAGC